MHKKILSFFLLLITAISTNLCAIRSLSEVLNDEAVIAVIPHLQNKETKAMLEQALVDNIEVPYNKLNNKYGDNITLACEIDIDALFQQLVRSGLDGKLNEETLEKLLETFAKFITQARSKKEISEKEVAQFISLAFTLRMTVVGLEFAIKNPTYQEKAMEKQDEMAQISTYISEKINEFLMKEFAHLIAQQQKA